MPIPAKFDWPYALRLIFQGRRVKLSTWTHGEYVFLGSPNCVKAPEHVLVALHNDGIRGSDTMHPCMWMRGADAFLVAGWQPSQADQMKSEWQLVSEPTITD
jgi:hypothetical protein